MFRTMTYRRTETGFSIVELMVGTVIAMVAILVIFNAFAAFEGQKRSTTTTNDVQAAGMLALQAIERDMRMAGYGMTVNNAIISNPRSRSRNEYAVTSASSSACISPSSVGRARQRASWSTQVTIEAAKYRIFSSSLGAMSSR